MIWTGSCDEQQHHLMKKKIGLKNRDIKVPDGTSYLSGLSADVNLFSIDNFVRFYNLCHYTITLVGAFSKITFHLF